MDDIILLRTPNSEEPTVYSKEEIDIINLNSLSIDDWIEALICFVSNDSTHHYSVNSNYYKLKELEYKFTWEFVTKVIQHKKFPSHKNEYFYLISEILNDMEGIEMKEINKYDRLYINSQTKENIRLINFYVDFEVYFNDVEIRDRN